MTTTTTSKHADGHGMVAAARTPLQVPVTGWIAVAKRVADEAKADRLTLLAAGVAFYLLVALVPTVGAVVSIYALFADPATVPEHLSGLAGAAPPDVVDVVTDAATRIADTSTGAAVTATLISAAGALWAASSGVGNLIEAIGVCYDEPGARGFAAKRAMAFAFTAAGAAFAAFALTALTAAPALADAAGWGELGRWAVSIGRWPLLAAAWMAALAALYRYAPERANAKWQWVTPGAVAATVAWLTASAGFSIYVANFGSYNETYGALGGAIVAMLWLFITAAAILIGAEINCEAERATGVDTTTGPPRPKVNEVPTPPTPLPTQPRAAKPTTPTAGAGQGTADGGSWGAVTLTAAGRVLAAVGGAVRWRRGRAPR